jgi:putative transcriptional regulator
MLAAAGLSTILGLAGLEFAGNGSDALAAGTLLVASDKLGDPNFAETVVLITRRDATEGTMGLVLNRPMDVTLAKAFPSLKANSDPVYDGGPVSPDAVQALLRASAKPADAERIAADIYLVARKAPLEKSIAEHLPSEKFRVYLGYAGWGPGQLENEIREGAWTTTRGVRYVFDGEPASLWPRLKRDAESQVAQAPHSRFLYTHATMKACCFRFPAAIVPAPQPCADYQSARRMPACPTNGQSQAFAPPLWRYSLALAFGRNLPPCWYCASTIAHNLAN